VINYISGITKLSLDSYIYRKRDAKSNCLYIKITVFFSYLDDASAQGASGTSRGIINAPRALWGGEFSRRSHGNV